MQRWLLFSATTVPNFYIGNFQLENKLKMLISENERFSSRDKLGSET
jgi:hypothetical protein